MGGRIKWTCLLPFHFLVLLSYGVSARWANLLPDGPLELHPYYEFDDVSKRCTSKEVLRSTYEGFALPDSSSKTLHIRFDGKLWCQDYPQLRQSGTLFTLGGGFDVTADCSSQTLAVNGGVLGSVSFPLASLVTSPSDDFEFTLAVDKGDLAQPLTLCTAGGASLPPTPSLSSVPPLLQHLTNGASILDPAGVTIGPSVQDQTLRATVRRLVVSTGQAAAGCRAAPSWRELEAQMARNRAAVVVELTSTPGVEVEVESAVRLVAKAEDPDGDAVKIQITVFGLSPERCDASSCGDATFEAGGASGAASVTGQVQFALPGRYIIRARASDGSGVLTWRDVGLIVRKRGDTASSAPCCRHTPYIVAQNIGRPVHHTEFRAPAVRRLAIERLGWSSAYWEGADLEAERLFDYSILAPAPQRHPVQTTTCADVRVAGAGSPEVYGLMWGAEEVTGHGKQLALVPEAFPWASADEVECQGHWSEWHALPANLPYAREAPGSATDRRTCCVGCTAAGTRHLLMTTGMAEQYAQALAQLSYGALSLAPQVNVLPEVQIEKGAGEGSAFAYYDTPARLAVAAAPGPKPWMRLVLTPLAYHMRPKHRAWSEGMASGGATITKCFASMYYAIHETGHRLGFRHGQLLKLDAGHAVPADPLGAGTFLADDAYRQRLDIMSCCQSDYGLYHRTVAGWLKSSQREVLTADDLALQSERRLVVWPFDRSESRGRLVSLAIRRSPREILLIGFRSASHWQDATAASAGDGNGNAADQQHRRNVRGIQVEFLRRQAGVGGTWSERAILDFNSLHGDWPDALPPGAGELPSSTVFSLLKEGHSWFDPASHMLLSFERLGECDAAPGMELHPHAAEGFYGFSGEWPGTETLSVQNDFSGYAALECAHLTLTTAADRPSGKLEIELTASRSAGGGGDGETITEEQLLSKGVEGVQGTALRAPFEQEWPCFQRSPAASSSGGAAAVVPSEESFLRLAVAWPAGPAAVVTSVTWKDNLNRTLLALPRDALAATSASVLPQLVPYSALPVSVHVLAADGRHSRAEVRLQPPRAQSGTTQVQARYKYYENEALSYDKVPLGVCNKVGLDGGASKNGIVKIAASAGGAVGGVLVLGCAVFAMLWMRRRRRRVGNDGGGKASSGDAAAAHSRISRATVIASEEAGK